MAGRSSLVRAEPGFTLPFFDRLAPPPPPALIAARIEADAKRSSIWQVAAAGSPGRPSIASAGPSASNRRR
jgi:hypothetical protein